MTFQDARVVFGSASTADDGTIVIPHTGPGFVIVAAEDDEMGWWAFEAAGTVLITAGTTNTAATDSDTDLCVYDNSGAVTIANRLGATKVLTYFVVMSPS